MASPFHVMLEHPLMSLSATDSLGECHFVYLPHITDYSPGSATLDVNSYKTGEVQVISAQ